MELKKHLNFKYIFIGLYVASFLAFIIYGVIPTNAVDAYEIDSELSMPSIGLNSGVTKLELGKDGLETPDTIVGSFSNNTNKTLLIGHSTTVFNNLKNVRLEDTFEYNGKTYEVRMIDMVAKDKISMNRILQSEEKDTIILMTCAGTLLNNGDATHRLIITALSE